MRPPTSGQAFLVRLLSAAAPLAETISFATVNAMTDGKLLRHQTADAITDHVRRESGIHLRDVMVVLTAWRRGRPA